MTTKNYVSKNHPPQPITDNMRPPAAAAYLGVSESYLAKLRMAGSRKMGPVFSRVSGCVIYRKADLDAWVAAHVVE